MNVYVALCAVMPKDKKPHILFCSSSKSIPTRRLTDKPRKVAGDMISSLLGFDSSYVASYEEGFICSEDLKTVFLVYSCVCYEPIPVKDESFEWMAIDEIINLRPMDYHVFEAILRSVNRNYTQEDYENFYNALEAREV